MVAGIAFLCQPWAQFLHYWSVLVMLILYVLPYQAAIPGLPYKPAFVIRQTSFRIIVCRRGRA